MCYDIVNININIEPGFTFQLILDYMRWLDIGLRLKLLVHNHDKCEYVNW